MKTFNEAHQVVQLIPKGKVTTYGLLAKFLSTSPRVIGWAMNAVAGTENIPAHRVVNRNGVLTGKHHFPSPTYMQEMLEQEGIEIVNNQVQNLSQHLWNPETDLI